MGTIQYDAGEEEVGDGFEPIPNGVYDLKIVEAEMGESKKGYPMATVNFVVINDEKYADKSINFHRVVFMPNSNPGAWIAKAFLKAIGQPYKGNIEIDTDAWVGKKVTASVYTDEYEGKKFNKIKNPRAITNGTSDDEGSHLSDELDPFL